MKQTSSALTFLMAQYRAIFKRAYIKGIASAVLLTAGLAAGQAQAATYNSLTTINDASGDVITIDGTASPADTANIEVKDDDKTLNKDVVFNLGNDSDFKITASGTAGTTVIMDGNKNDITINGNGTGSGDFTFGAEDADEKLQIKNLGTLTIQNNAKVTVTAGSGSSGAGVDVYADTIKIDNSTVDILQHVSGSSPDVKGQNAILRGKTITVTGSDAVINLGSADAARSGGGRATLGWRSDATLDSNNNPTSNKAGSDITLSGGATLNLIGRTEDANAYNTQGSQVWGDSLTADKSFVEVSGAGAQIWTHTNKFTDTSLHVANKAQLVIKPFEFRVMKDGNTDNDHSFSFINGTTTFDGGNLVVEGNLQVAGTVVINDNVNLTAGEAAFNKEDSAKSNELYNGVLTVGLGSDFTSENDKAIETESVLKISSSKLNEFLTASTTQTKYEDAQGTEKTYADKAGILSFGAGKATLYFTDTTQVDLSKFKWIETDMSASGAGNTAEAGAIVYDTSLAGSGTQSNYSGATVGVTVFASDMLVSKALDEGAKKINLAATNLTLGSRSYTGTDSLNFSGATAQHLTFEGDFNLADKVTLTSTRSVTQEGTELVVSDNGTITGDATFVSGGSLTVELGDYTANGDFVISGGALTVQNTGATSKADSTLAMTGKLDIVTSSSASGTIVVDGKNASGDTILDLSKADVTFKAEGNKSFSLKVQSGGELVMDAADFQGLLTAETSANKSGAQVTVGDSGTISLVGNASIAADKLFSGSVAADGKLLFSGSGNTLDVDGQLTITGTANVNIGTGNEIVARSLQLNNVTAGKATLQTGDITVIDALTSSNASNTISVSGASLDLGDWADLGADATYDQALSTTGTLGANLSIDATGSVVTVKNGTWTGSSSTVTVNSGSLVVGETGKVDASGAAITATLDIAKLDAKSAYTAGSSGVEVSAGSTIKTTELNAAANSINVDGTMEVAGKYTSGAATDGSQDTYGVNLAADSITVNYGGKLNFGEAATDAITLGTEAGNLIQVAGNTFAAGAINLAGGEVGFAFDSGASFTKEAIAELRNDIFGVTTGNLVDGFINLGDGTIEGLPSGSGDIAWDDLEGFSDIIADVTTNNLQQNTVTGITSTDEVRGNVGSLETTAGTTTVNVVGNTTLNNAAGNGGAFVADANGTVGSINASKPATVTLNNGGTIDDITMQQGGTLAINSVAGATEGAYGTTVQGDINAPAAQATFAPAEGATTADTIVQGRTEVAQLTTAAGANTVFNGRVIVGQSATANQTSVLEGVTTFNDQATFAQAAQVKNTATFNGDTTFEQAATIAAQTSFAQDVAFEGTTEILGNTKVAGIATVSNGLSIDSGARVEIQELAIESGSLSIGSDGASGDSGFLDVARLSLNGNALIIDPQFGKKASLALIEQFNDTFSGQSQADAGYMGGDVYVLKNSIVAIGNVTEEDVNSTFAEYIDQATGSLIEDNTGAIAYVADSVTIGSGYRLVVDPSVTTEGTGNVFDPADYVANRLTINGNGALAVEVDAAKNGAAITFEANDASVTANKDAKVLLTGKYEQSDRITLFTDGNGSVDVVGDPIKVQTINGLLTWDYDGSQQSFTIGEMEVDTKRAATAFSATSSPVHNSLVAYGTGNTAWYDKTADKEATKTHGASLNSLYAYDNGTFYERDAQGNVTTTAVDPDELSLTHVKNPAYVDGTKTPNEPQYLVYAKADNALLEAITQQENNNGASAESAARMADFAGVAQVALKAGASTYEAISGRMGMGATNTTITYANNGQGAGIWLTPIYQNSDSDGFDAQGVNYGTDINLYGVALGGDYTLTNGVRVGALFNVGSGDADGQGAGSAVTSDFDYYGFGLYAGYTMGQFSIVGDVSYTVVDNDVEASTEFGNIGKLETSLDSANLSIGVTGAYAFETTAGIEVTPHVGLRYSNIDIDDYTVDSKAGTIGSYSADSLSVFSIPVGVTIASEFQAGTWSVKPSFDVTLTGNFGDDENEGTFHWNGVENIDSSLTSEIFDNFTYGATLGVAAQSASGISLGLSVGYTGSSNVDDFGVNANARFTF